METKVDTLIVGGGMAGMFCALRLQEAGLPYLVVTERLGGRVMYKSEYRMNFGAVFYFENEPNIRKVLAPGPRLLTSPWQIQFHLSDHDSYSCLSFRMFKSLWQVLGFRRFIKTFVTHYAAYRKNCETVPVKAALKADPFLERLFFMPAAQLLDELGVAEGCNASLSFFTYLCTGFPLGALSAFDYCLLSQGLLVPMHFFSFSESEMQERLGNVEFDSVISVEKAEHRHRVATAKGRTIVARNLVIATSSDAAKTLIELPRIRSASRFFAYLVQGRVKEQYRAKNIHMFAEPSPILYLAKREDVDDEFEIFANASLDLDKYFIEYSVRHAQEWPQAVYAHPALVLDQDLGDSLYLAGDQNGIGMESAAISGIYAANRIIGANAAGNKEQ